MVPIATSSFEYSEKRLDTEFKVSDTFKSLALPEAEEA
jgi:hypothetical protein